MPAAPFAALCLLASPWTPPAVDVFLSVATFLMCMSQQFHAWAHMKKSELPAAVDALQVVASVMADNVASVQSRTSGLQCSLCFVLSVLNRQSHSHFCISGYASHVYSAVDWICHFHHFHRSRRCKHFGRNTSCTAKKSTICPYNLRIWLVCMLDSW